MGFDEAFEVAEGTLAFIVDGKKRTLSKGDKVTVPAGTAHKFFNETDSRALIAGENAVMPAVFAGYLSQLYGFLDASQANQRPPRILLQLSMWYPHFDSTLAEGPPPAVLKAMFWLLQPPARLLGYKNFYEEYRPERSAEV